MTDTSQDSMQPTEEEALSKTEQEKREFEEKRKNLRVDLPENPLPLMVYFKFDNQIITAKCDVVNFSLGGMLLKSNESLPLRATMKAQYKNKGILIEGIRQQGSMYGIQFHHMDMFQLYDFYLELINDVIFDGHVCYLTLMKKA